MKRLFKTICFVLPLAALLFASCEEVQEASKYDNWQARNEAYIDSIAGETGKVFVATLEDADRMEPGRLFAIATTSGTTAGEQYVYCKKITANPEGRRPLYTETVSAYYYGTLITGDKFDGNFTGYSAVDRQELNAEDKKPTEFDAPAEFAVSGVITGWTAALQLMRTGERWMLYIPYQSAYGTSGSGSIPGYSALAFDIILDDIVADEE
ncbi:FKBP-type peptidyl-prolyl cis-trans isomerase [uncultured Mediterranea sp.]|uniref:FKBP-type peptidyl-prolyl cis-trans isomerase n=1 Tax=uncultured Mediterranea sp. TaxID=1926662 RepID=UPI002803A5AE|nr:FKBP-type peptidyl-prolyl cis-trans isomerase [uncultured Mediterranea sp.]